MHISNIYETVYIIWKERALPKGAIYVTVSQLPDDGQKMSYCKIRIKALLGVALFNK